MTYGIESDEEHEETSRFARQVIAWLQQKMAAYEIERLVILAPPRFLGVLRNEQSAHVAVRTVEHRGELVNLPAKALSEHPVIRDLVGLD